MFFEITIKFGRTDNRKIVVEAENYTEAEAKVQSYLEEIQRKSLKTSIKELSKFCIRKNTDNDADIWFKATIVNGISESGKELTKKILFNAKNSQSAFDLAENYAVNENGYEAARCVQLKETDISEVILKDEE